MLGWRFRYALRKAVELYRVVPTSRDAWARWDRQMWYLARRCTDEQWREVAVAMRDVRLGLRSDVVSGALSEEVVDDR